MLQELTTLQVQQILCREGDKIVDSLSDDLGYHVPRYYPRRDYAYDVNQTRVYVEYEISQTKERVGLGQDAFFEATGNMGVRINMTEDPNETGHCERAAERFEDAFSGCDAVEGLYDTMCEWSDDRLDDGRRVIDIMVVFKYEYLPRGGQR